MALWRRSRRGRPWATWAGPVGWPRTRGRAAGVGSVPACLAAAADLVDAAGAEATAETEVLDAAETSALREALGAGLVRGSGKASTTLPRGAAGDLKELESGQKSS